VDHDHAAAVVRNIQADHMDGRNSDRKPWADIAYNFLIDPWGYVFVGRGWDNRCAANGDAITNSHMLAICYLGGEDDPFTDAAKEALASAVREAQTAHGFGSIVQPHSEYFLTRCPGDEIRNWIAQGLQVPSAPQPTPQPTEDDMFDAARTIRYPDGSVTVASPDGGIENFGTPFFGSVPQLKPEHRKSFTECHALRPVNSNDSNAGYIVCNADGSTYAFNVAVKADIDAGRV
jgi:hypothetical protein